MLNQVQQDIFALSVIRTCFGISLNIKLGEK